MCSTLKTEIIECILCVIKLEMFSRAILFIKRKLKGNDKQNGRNSIDGLKKKYFICILFSKYLRLF